MIRLVEALNFRCLQYVRQPLGRFSVLVGPNASGKTTFLDVVGFLGQMVSEGLEAALDSRTRNFKDLVWLHKADTFELAVEAAVPEVFTTSLKDKLDTIRYEVRIGPDPESQEVGILEERVSLKEWTRPAGERRTLFPFEARVPETIFGPKRKSDQTVVTKAAHNNAALYYPEVRPKSADERPLPPFRLGRKRSALANLPEDESLFPVATWFKRFLSQGVERFVLNSQKIRMASPPGQGRGFKTDGSNLPWVIEDLRNKGGSRFYDWVQHLRTALPDLKDVQTVEREDDRHRYLKLLYENGLEVPSWMASDGTLRLLALTIPAYLEGFEGVYLIEEPENGIHPGAMETLFQSLSSVYGAQVLVATHSPVLLSQAKVEEILCFKKTETGATDIVLGSEHPQLRDWRGQPNMDVLFASGVLG